jgi:hypothetical protein
LRQSNQGAAEYEAAMKINGQSMMQVPTKLVPEIEVAVNRVIASGRVNCYDEGGIVENMMPQATLEQRMTALEDTVREL